MKVVFHVDELRSMREARRNIENLLVDGQAIDIIFLANGEAVQGYLLPAQIKFMKEHPSVTYHACHHAMRAYHVRSKQLFERVQVVDSGVLDLIELQTAGYQYIKP